MTKIYKPNSVCCMYPLDSTWKVIFEDDRGALLEYSKNSDRRWWPISHIQNYLIEKKQPRTLERWISIYQNKITGGISSSSVFRTEFEAKTYHPTGYDIIDTFRIYWEEKV